MGTIAIGGGVLLGMVARIGMLLGGLFWLFGLISLQDVILRHYWRSAAQTPEREVTRDVGSSHCSYPIHVKTLHISGGRPRERQFVSPLQGFKRQIIKQSLIYVVLWKGKQFSDAALRGPGAGCSFADPLADHRPLLPPVGRGLA